MPAYDGGCFCGAVRYRMKSDPMFVHCCHCTDCQCQTGGAFAINAIVEADRVEILSGTPEPVEMPTESGRPHDIYRCPKCRIAVWSDYGRRKVMLFVRVSTLDNRHTIVPDVHIFVRSKVPWERLPDGVPAFDVYYKMAEQWPAESLARREAVLGKGK